MGRSRAAVLAAATAILVRDGMSAVSVEAVAAASGVAKTTIYRHWPGRAQLLSDALRGMTCSFPPPDTGDVREDLVRLLGGLAHALRTEPWARALAGAGEAADRDPVFADLQRAFADECRRPLTEVLRGARARGEVRSDLDEPLAAALLAGPLFYRRFVSLEPLDPPGLAAALVDAVLPGMRPPGAAGTAAAD